MENLQIRELVNRLLDSRVSDAPTKKHYNDLVDSLFKEVDKDSTENATKD